MQRTPMSPGALFDVLDREFFRHKPAACMRCLTPPVVRLRDGDPDCSDWFVAPLAACEYGCSLVLRDLVARLQERYCLEVGDSCDIASGSKAAQRVGIA